MPPAGDVRFGPYRLDLRSQRLLRGEVALALPKRRFQLLQFFVEHPDTLLTKDVLMQAVWKGTFVQDAALTQAVFHLRNLLDPKHPERYIETAARVGYRFVAPITRAEARLTDQELDARLGPYLELMDGRAALETLARDRIDAARAVFERLVAHDPQDAGFRIGLANACVLQFESTRADPAPDTEALRLALVHAREARRLDPERGEAWATLAFVLERTGDRMGALAALRHAVALEPDNWRHHLRLSSCSWGEERLRAARRTLALCPGLRLAHLLAATVYVARGALDLAEREIDAGLAAMPADEATPVPFPAVGLHWLKGLLLQARGQHAEALDAWNRELVLEPLGHLYGREIAANTLYAIGACHLGRGDEIAASAAFDEVHSRVPGHAMARAAHGRSEDRPLRTDDPLRAADDGAAGLQAGRTPIDAALASAASLVATDDAAGAARIVADALAAAPPGNAGWLIPIEPLLRVDRAREAWAPVLALLCTRAV